MGGRPSKAAAPGLPSSLNLAEAELAVAELAVAELARVQRTISHIRILAYSATALSRLRGICGICTFLTLSLMRPDPNCSENASFDLRYSG